MRGTPFVHILLFALVVSALHGPAGTVSAQAPSDPANLFLQDPTGDIGPFGVTPPVDAFGDTYAHVDLTFLEIGNDAPDRFQLMLGVGGFGGTTQTVSQALAVMDFQCTIRWTYAHQLPDTDYRYEITISSDLLREPGGDGPGEANLYWQHYYFGPNGGHGYGWSDWPDDTLQFDDARNAFVVTMPKAWAPVWPGGHAPAAGDQLVPENAACWTDVALYGQVYDFIEIPEGTTYAFTTPGAGGDVRVGFERLDGPGAGIDPGAWQPPTSGASTGHIAPVAPGTPTKVPVYLANNGDSRKLLQLSAAPIEDAATGWNLTITPSIMVPAGDVRTVNLIVTPPAGVTLGSTLPITVEARLAGEARASAAAATLRVTPPLDAEHNTYYIHSQAYETDNPADAAFSELSPYYRLHASLLENEPGYDDPPARVTAISGYGDGHALDPLVHPVRLDTAKPVEVTLAFEGDAAREVAVAMYLFTQDAALFAMEQDVPGDGVTTIEAILAGEGILELEQGSELYFQMYVGATGVGPERASEVAMLPVETRFALPVVGGAQSLTATDGRFLPSLALGKDEEASTYVNPGNEYAFDLVLANEGIETDDIRLSVNSTNATGWQVDVMPGAAFRVQPGNSTPFSLVVVAPEDAPEGQRAVFELIAQSKHDAAVRTELRLDATVTTGVQIEPKPYADKEGQLDPLEDEKAGAPALPVAALVAALVAVAAWRRRP